MRRTAAGSLAAASLAAGASQAPPSLNPVQEAEASAGLLIAGVAGALVGAAGLSTYQDFVKGGDSSASEIKEKTAEDVIHDVGSGLASERAERRDMWQQEWLDKGKTKTPFAKTAFDAAESAAAIEIVNDTGEETAAAQEAVDKQLVRAITTMQESFNRALIGGVNDNGLLPAITTAVSENKAGLMAPPDSLNNAGPQAYAKSDTADEWVPVEGSQKYDPETGDGLDEWTVWRYEPGWENPPIPFKQVGGIEQDGGPEILGWSYDRESGQGLSCPWAQLYEFHSDKWTNAANSWDTISQQPLYVNHSNRSRLKPLDTGKISDVMRLILEGKQQLENDLGTYIPNLNQALAEGTISIEDIVSPRQGLETFNNSDEQTLLAASMTFSGIGVPSKEDTFQAKISHNDIASDSLWVNLYVSSENDVSIEPGTTIPASDYSSAFIGYRRADNGKHEERWLSGNSDLEILDVADTSIDRETGAEDESAGSNGGLNLWNPENRDEETPPWLEFPDSDEYKDVKVVVEGADGTTSTHDLSEIVREDGVYKLPNTNLSEGTAIEGVRYIRSPTLTSKTDYVPDPANVDTQAIQDRINGRAEMLDRLNELAESNGGLGGGGFFGDNFPTLPGLGVPGTIVALFLGLFGLGQLSR
jgi:hypothetical protein